MIEAGSKTELCLLAEKYHSDKCFYYTPFYHLLLGERRGIRKVLELGIGYPELMLDSIGRAGWTEYTTGASLYMWRDYFPNAEIYALDNRREILIFDKNRIHSFYCDQTDPATYPLKELGGDFDLIVEDGLHEPAPQMTALKTLVPLVRKGGIYIVEDLGYMNRAEKREFVLSIPYPSELIEFENKKFGDHIAAIVVIRP